VKTEKRNAEPAVGYSVERWRPYVVVLTKQTCYIRS